MKGSACDNRSDTEAGQSGHPANDNPTTAGPSPAGDGVRRHQRKRGHASVSIILFICSYRNFHQANRANKRTNSHRESGLLRPRSLHSGAFGGSGIVNHALPPPGRPPRPAPTGPPGRAREPPRPAREAEVDSPRRKGAQGPPPRAGTDSPGGRYRYHHHHRRPPTPPVGHGTTTPRPPAGDRSGDNGRLPATTRASPRGHPRADIRRHSHADGPGTSTPPGPSRGIPGSSPDPLGLPWCSHT